MKRRGGTKKMTNKKAISKTQPKRKLTTKKIPTKKLIIEQLPTDQITTEQLSTNQESSSKKNYRPLAIVITIIIITGLIIFSISGQITNEPQQGVFKQSKIGKNSCFFGNLPLKYDASNIFTCDTNEDCINTLIEYHKSTDTPIPSQSVLESIECLP